MRGTDPARVSKRFRSDATPAGTSREGAATPSSNILNFFFPPSPPGLQRGYNSNDPRLSISRKGFSKWGGGCRYAIFYFLFFLFLSSFLPFHSREREMVNWISRLTLGFPFFSIRATSVT